MKGKLIVIEGTDCSGKETQSNLLLERLASENINIYKSQCPFYDSPTGKIIAGPYLGKENYCDSYFTEGASKVDPKVAGLYYSADRKYNIHKVEEHLKSGHVLLDRYVDSNMAHQGGSITNKKERRKMYRFFEKLEYGLLGLPHADIKILLYMPVEFSRVLRQNRKEKMDGIERDENSLFNAERAYLEIAKRNKYKIIHCVKDGKIRSIQEIQEDVYKYVKGRL